MTKILRSCFVAPENETPKHSIWLSDIDLTQPPIYTSTVMLYNHNGEHDFFDIEVVKDGLRKALVPFYPLAGRFGTDENGRTEIVCNATGALFAEAEAEMTLRDFGDYLPTMENLLMFLPLANLSGDETPPLLLIQVTSFKCGSICIGTGIHHFVSDGMPYWNFINTWASFTSSHSLQPLEFPPFYDRSLLRPRPSPSPVNEYSSEYERLVASATKIDNNKPQVQILKLTKSQVSTIKNTNPQYSTFQLIAAHLWKCACKAGQNSNTTKSCLFITVDYRNRIRPSLPNGYFGNAVLWKSVVENAATVIAEPVSGVAGKIQRAITQLDDEFLRSAIDFLAMQESLMGIWSRGPDIVVSDLFVNSWMRFPAYETDFGWGRPTFSGPALVINRMCYVLPSPEGDGGLWIAISLETECMERFKGFFFEI